MASSQRGRRWPPERGRSVGWDSIASHQTKQEHVSVFAADIVRLSGRRRMNETEGGSGQMAETNGGGRLAGKRLAGESALVYGGTPGIRLPIPGGGPRRGAPGGDTRRPRENSPPGEEG